MVKIEAYLKEEEENFLPSLGTKLGSTGNENQIIGFQNMRQEICFVKQETGDASGHTSKCASTSNLWLPNQRNL